MKSFLDYVDLRGRYDPVFQDAAKAISLKTFDDVFGMSEDAYAETLEATPPDLRTPWNPDMNPFFPCDEGLEWCAKLKEHIEANPDQFEERLNQRAFALEAIELFRRVLQRGKDREAQFELFYGT